MINARRCAENPVVTPAMVPPSGPDFEVVCAFNAGVAQCNGDVILLLRVAERARSDAKVARVPVLNCTEKKAVVEILDFDKSDKTIDFRDPRLIRTPTRSVLTTLSHLRVARSKDGIHFKVDPKPALFPDRPSEQFGIEDPRITEIDGVYHIVYKGVSPDGISVGLAETRDFKTYQKRGIIFCPENLDVCIFPEKINGRYAALTRPVPKTMGAPNMWMAYSPDLMCWGDHHFLMGVQPGKWDSGRIGGGAIPIKTDRGWLTIYHGATKDDVYCLGVVLLDLDDPRKVIARGAEPLLKPEAVYETSGFMKNVVFTCGALHGGDIVSVYYGASDEVMARADFSMKDILASL